jgi:hypothetical protein
MNLEDEYNYIISQLEERKSTHFHIANTWIYYLQIKKQKLEQAISDTKQALCIMDHIENDISPEMMECIWSLTKLDNREK